MSRGITSVEGIYPSTSGNIRIKVSFTRGEDLHFYMKPNGDLHFPSTHYEDTLKNPVVAEREYKWVLKTWQRTNKGIKKEQLTGELRKLAVKLCLTLENPKESYKVFLQAKVTKPTTNKLGSVHGGTFTKIKNLILHSQNKKSEGELSPIDKFKNKYSKVKTV